MLILGIDPGSVRVGFGLIKKDRGLKLLKCGLLKIQSKEKSGRFLELENSFRQLIKKEKPNLVALEKLYFMKNQKTGLEVAEARGILILNIIKAKIPFVEYSPSQIKNSVAGYGLADKTAVARMCAKILGVDKIKGFDDVSDAVAVAITASNVLLTV
ncbi:MAG: crossover junction endodeoxyribonuclease RuvC [Patescibacteria group bacterium]